MKSLVKGQKPNSSNAEGNEVDTALPTEYEHLGYTIRLLCKRPEVFMIP